MTVPGKRARTAGLARGINLEPLPARMDGELQQVQREHREAQQSANEKSRIRWATLVMQAGTRGDRFFSFPAKFRSRSKYPDPKKQFRRPKAPDGSALAIAELDAAATASRIIAALS